METFVNDYYQKIALAINEVERAQIKAEFAAILQTLGEGQKRQVRALIGIRIDSFLETLAPIDEAINEFNDYLKKRQSQNMSRATKNAA